MARPRKAIAEELSRIVDLFYESHGDASKLKCSLLAEYAVSLGMDVKAYDFRRSSAARQRIDEIQSAADERMNAGLLVYRNLDADAFVAKNATKAELKGALLELDSYWRGIFERSVHFAGENTALLSQVYALKRDAAKTAAVADALNEELSEKRKSENALVAENRYLRTSLERYLYPAVANEILLRERVLKQVDTEVADNAMAELADASPPLSLTAATERDRQALSRSGALLERMKAQIQCDEEKDEYLRRALEGYMASIGTLTDEEKQELSEWVASGNSVYDNPHFFSDERGFPLGFIEAFRANIDMCENPSDYFRLDPPESGDGCGGEELPF
jgi:hypothetical protein